jgi:hypothetical protein
LAYFKPEAVSANIQHFMALSALNAPLPALEDLITLTPKGNSAPGSLVKEAWEAVGADELLALVREMPARCEAVTDAQGGYTKY